jgi:hypothetical protein
MLSRRLRLSLIVLAFAALPVAPAHAAGCPDLGATDPCLTLTPDHGPAGTHVQISGRITSHLSTWRAAFDNPDGYFALYTDIPPGSGPLAGCELIIGGDHATVSMTADGVVTGSFIVGRTGTCFQQSDVEHPTQPGRYVLAVGCQACGVANFTVTPSSLAFTGVPSLLVPVAVAVFAIAVGGLLSVRVGTVRVGRVRRHTGPAQRPLA